MSVAQLDESLLPILENATERVVIRRKDGTVLGVFKPEPQGQYVRQSPYSEEEIREVIRNKGECISIAEFWKRMGVQ